MALSITRTPTVLSLHQNDEPTPPTTKDFGRPGSIKATALNPEGRFARLTFAQGGQKGRSMMLRVRSFGSFEDTDAMVPDLGSGSPSSSPPTSDSDDAAPEPQSAFDRILLGQWEERAERGLFRYDVTACKTRVLDGDFGFIAQLNEGRAQKKRPTEFRVDLVCQDFDEGKFNFTKAGDEEVLFAFQPVKGGDFGYVNSADCGRSPNLLVINVSPIEYGHVLLVPRVMDLLPQQIRPDLLLLALQMAVESRNPYYRVGYNSLGAYATINHLHFQAYYLAAPFPIERAPTRKLTHTDAKRKSSDEVVVERTVRFPVRSLVFHVGKNLNSLAEAVGNACEKLQARNIPFNLLIADRGARVFLIPNLFSKRMAEGKVPEEIIETGINPAVFEISGHLLYKTKEDYYPATQQSAWELLAQASFSEEEFLELASDIC